MSCCRSQEGRTSKSKRSSVSNSVSKVGLKKRPLDLSMERALLTFKRAISRLGRGGDTAGCEGESGWRGSGGGRCCPFSREFGSVRRERGQAGL